MDAQPNPIVDFGFEFSSASFASLIGDEAFALPRPEPEPEFIEPPRFAYGAMHSAIKRNREWFR